MSRRVSLPGADELFRTTGGGMGLQPSSPAERRRKANGEPRVPAPAGESDPSGQAGPSADREEHTAADADGGDSRGRGGEGERAPSAKAAGERPAAEQPRRSSPSAGAAAHAARTAAPAAGSATTRRSRSTSPPRS
nr:hypothetical protein [Streptomyces sp. YPW6]